jgi:hypothetical protein
VSGGDDEILEGSLESALVYMGVVGVFGRDLSRDSAAPRP